MAPVFILFMVSREGYGWFLCPDLPSPSVCKSEFRHLRLTPVQGESACFAADNTYAAAKAFLRVDSSLESLAWRMFGHFNGPKEAPLHAVLAAGANVPIHLSPKPALLQYPGRRARSEARIK